MFLPPATRAGAAIMVKGARLTMKPRAARRCLGLRRAAWGILNVLLADRAFQHRSRFGILAGLLNVFRYITFRTGGAMVTGALFVFLFGPWIIDHLRLRQGKGQPIRTDGPQSHLITKKGTPTMGGLMILSGLVVSTLLWANPLNPYVWIVLAVTLGFGFVGFYDDYLKVTKQTPQRLLPASCGLRSKPSSRCVACYRR